MYTKITYGIAVWRAEKIFNDDITMPCSTLWMMTSWYLMLNDEMIIPTVHLLGDSWCPILYCDAVYVAWFRHDTSWCSYCIMMLKYFMMTYVYDDVILPYGALCSIMTSWYKCLMLCDDVTVPHDAMMWHHVIIPYMAWWFHGTLWCLMLHDDVMIPYGA